MRRGAPTPPAPPPDGAPWVGDVAGGARLRLHVVPRAREDRCAGPHGGSLKIALRAPPVDDRANRALLDFLAAALGCPLSRLELLGGRNSREKTVLARGLRSGDVAGRLARAAGPEA